jgi:hypothetical protein
MLSEISDFRETWIATNTKKVPRQPYPDLKRSTQAGMAIELQ